MKPERVFEAIHQYGVIPVIAIEAVSQATALADALMDGGLHMAEITFRTPVAAQVIEAMALHRPDMLLGAGTLLRASDVKAAKAAGASFGVAPGLNPKTVKQAALSKLPFAPGVCTPSDIESALEMGCKIVKFFPAEACGGAAALKALSAPYAHTGIKFIPTGGVNLENLAAYLELETVVAVGGTWIAKSDDMAAGRWKEIVLHCKRAAEVVRRVRG
jgi:2-dehydro-3-deoxyphosphogluconate aldolase/(4S)-4-hydroxy-2-oxoglutarate aldolase